MTPAAIAAVKNGQTRSCRGETGAVCSLQTFDPLNDALRSTGIRGAAPLSAKLPKMPAILLLWKGSGVGLQSISVASILASADEMRDLAKKLRDGRLAIGQSFYTRFIVLGL